MEIVVLRYYEEIQVYTYDMQIITHFLNPPKF